MLNKEKAYATGVLVPAVHNRLVQDITNVALDAVIQPKWIWTGLKDANISAGVTEYVRKYKFHPGNDVFGLVLGTEDPDNEVAAIAGALVRNFIRARVATLDSFIKSEGMLDYSCVLIPNFFYGSTKSGKEAQAPWRVGSLLDSLVARHVVGLQTVVCVSDMGDLLMEYGSPIKRHLINNFTVVI